MVLLSQEDFDDLMRFVRQVIEGQEDQEDQEDQGNQGNQEAQDESPDFTLDEEIELMMNKWDDPNYEMEKKEEYQTDTLTQL